ncbi:14111_t:CDS:1, partial [Entrophospora sp. SA101]
MTLHLNGNQNNNAISLIICNQINFHEIIDSSDIIRIGVVDFEKEYNSSNFVKLKNKFTFKLDELVPTTKIPKNILEMIKNISKVKTFEESEKLLKRIY